ncbi:MAG: (2Fe-2S)-binding protein [Patulibacter sp.]
MASRTTHFACNGESVAITVDPRTTAAEAIREQLGLTGTHVACQTGVCGTCTVLVDGEPVRSCLMLAVQLDGSTVTTVEGVGADHADGLHPVQRAFVEHHSFQCGFCAPGFVLSTVALLEGDEPLDREVIRDALADNLCRCTGYQAIVDGATAAAERLGRLDPPAGGVDA